MSHWSVWIGCFYHGVGPGDGRGDGFTCVTTCHRFSQVVEVYQRVRRQTLESPHCHFYRNQVARQVGRLSGAALAAREDKLLRAAPCEVVVWIDGRRVVEGKGCEITTITPDVIESIPVIFNAPLATIYRNKAQWEHLKRGGIIRSEWL